MLKTTMGMLGEYEYDTVYNDNEVPPVTWVLYLAFLVINCIIIMNLLVSSIWITVYCSLPWLLEETEILVGVFLKKKLFFKYQRTWIRNKYDVSGSNVRQIFRSRARVKLCCGNLAPRYSVAIYLPN